MRQRDLHIQSSAVVQRGNVHLGIQDLNLSVGLDVARGDFTGTHGFNVNRLGAVRVELGQQSLNVQNNVCHVFLDAGNRGKFMRVRISSSAISMEITASK